MSDYHCMQIDANEVLMGVVELAKKHGWKQQEEDDHELWQQIKVLIIYASIYEIGGNVEEIPSHACCRLYDINTLIKIIIHDGPICKIGEYNVIKTDTGIKVGCQGVTKEQIKQIYDAIFN